MHTLTDLGAAIAPAKIVDVSRESAAVWVRRRDTDDDASQIAQVAIPWTSALCSGATVLIASGEDEALYVIGVLQSPTAFQRQQIATSDGVTAVATRPGDSESLQVISKSGELLFEYDARTHRTRVHLRPGDVQFVAHEGGIDFVASGGIRLQSQQAVDIQGQLGVRLDAGERGASGPSLSLGAYDARLSGPRVGITTPLLDVTAVETRLTGRKFLGRVVQSRLAVENLEMVLGTLVQKAKNVFRRVAGLDELHAKNSRTLVEDSLHVKAGRINVKADGNVKIDGEQIHLG